MMETLSEITESAVPALRARLRHVYWIGGGYVRSFGPEDHLVERREAS
jgi:hypothetical protein